jgi:hypothetical protein
LNLLDVRAAVLFVDWVRQYDEHGSFKLDHPTGAAKLSGAGQHGQFVRKSGRDYFMIHQPDQSHGGRFLGFAGA